VLLEFLQGRSSGMSSTTPAVTTIGTRYACGVASTEARIVCSRTSSCRQITSQLDMPRAFGRDERCGANVETDCEVEPNLDGPGLDRPSESAV